MEIHCIDGFYEAMQEKIVAHARDIFPTGLYQPEGAFRFSSDALLLASFGKDYIPAGGRFVDLGTGCGIVALAVLLNHMTANGIGIEREPVLADAARINAVRLGLENRFFVASLDVINVLSLGIEPVDVVVANPPWRIEGRGRMPVSYLRRVALFGHKNTLYNFARAAYNLLKCGGMYLSIVGIEYAQAQYQAVESLGFEPIEQTICAAKPCLPPCFALTKAVKSK